MNNNYSKSIISKGVNDAGRGLNIVVVGNGKEILKTAHFDTYAEGEVYSIFSFSLFFLNKF
jgi:hypothetical protein